MTDFAHRQDGITSIEFSLVIVPLLVLLFGIVKVGQVMWIQNALNYSVEQAARCGAVDPAICATPGQIQNFAATAAGPNIPATFAASTQTCGSFVLATYTMTLSAPLLSYSVPLTAQACYPE